MNLNIKKIGNEDVLLASEILVDAFQTDNGMSNLFNTDSQKYLQQLQSWFIATLKMQISSNQILWGIFKENSVIALAIVTKHSALISPFVLFKWTISVLINCSWKTILKTMAHDKYRQQFYISKNQYILEFIAVSPKHQGQGLSKLLFNKIHELTEKKTIWLETTKAQNVNIFNKFGYKKIKETKEKNIIYHIMTLEKEMK